ncbi:MAG: gluconate:H+ symporter [Bacteroidetes bacterium]|nr:gluconate:H+ symporter [Bacteroidota bacterium]
MILLLLSIALLLALIIFVRLNAFMALIISTLFVGVFKGMSPVDLIKSIQNGIGSTLGGLVMVLACGVILGSVLAETGAAQVIAQRLLRVFGPSRANLAILSTGFVVGIAMFYNAGFMVLAPLVFTVNAVSGQPLVPLAISMAAPLSVTHGFLPPHPGATAVANLFGADMGRTLLFGLALAIPSILVAGLFFPSFLKKIPAKPPAGLFQVKEFAPESLPGFPKSLLVALTPVVLMAFSTVMELNYPDADQTFPWLAYAGDPGIAMLISVCLALLLLSKNPLSPNPNFMTASDLLDRSATAMGAGASLMLVVAAGGAFKQVLVDSGIGKELAAQLTDAPVSPLVLGWSIATLLRIAVGSATVAGMTAAGIVQPLVAAGGVSPELMTLVVGAGSLMCSHVNDTGFWMFKEWFGLSLRDTFRSWTLMETIIGVMGLLGALFLDLLF